MTTDLETISMLRNSLERYTADHYDFLKRSKSLEQPERFNAQAWEDLAEFGFLGLRIPESAGGLEADAVAIGSVMEVVGERLMMEPILASGILGTGLLTRLSSKGEHADLLEQVAAGRIKLAVAYEDADSEDQVTLKNGRISGCKVSVLHGDCADQLLVTARDDQGNLQVGLVASSSSGLHRQDYHLVDGRGAARIRFDNVEVELLQAPTEGWTVGETVELLIDEANAALCAEAFGIIRSLVRITNEYLKVRTQFGQPLSSNQVLQHRMADLYLLQEEVKALTRMAEQAMVQPAEQRSLAVSGAKAYVVSAAQQVARAAIQLHGGLGITEELEISHYFRRVMVINALFGGRDQHFQRFVDQALSPAARTNREYEVEHA